MYFNALYIGLGSLLLTHMCFTVIPYYSAQVQTGAWADETLWWHCVYHAPSSAITMQYISTALSFGVFWALSYLHVTQIAGAWTYSIHDLFIWFGLLWLLARIDYSCLLLPDVFTQTLLWWGLLQLSIKTPELLTTTLWATSGVYLSGRLIQFFGKLCFALPLVGLGDVKLLVAITPWLGASALLYVLCLACVLCFLTQAYKQGSWRPTGSCAFGPYLVSASWLVWWCPHSFVL